MCSSDLGTPSATAPWMLQFGGHHLAINLTMGGSQASMAPSLPAAQPATYTIEGRTIRPLGDENDKAFALINALENARRSQAILGYRVSDLVLGPGQDGRTIQPEGIRASALSATQQAMLVDLVQEWAGIMPWSARRRSNTLRHQRCVAKRVLAARCPGFRPATRSRAIGVPSGEALFTSTLSPLNSR